MTQNLKLHSWAIWRETYRERRESITSEEDREIWKDREREGRKDGVKAKRYFGLGFDSFQNMLK